MRHANPSLNARLRLNNAELKLRLSRRQLFPLVSDGPEARKILAEIAESQAILVAAIEKDEQFDREALARRRLKQWRSLLAARYEEWRTANAKTAAS